MKEITLTQGQGGPVAVTKIEPKILTKEDYVVPSFLITIKNVGKGEVFMYGKSEEACSSLDELENSRKFFNYVKVEARLGDKVLVCDKNAVRLDKNKEGRVRCSLGEGISREKESYISNLIVTLSYGYTQTISKDVEIRKIFS